MTPPRWLTWVFALLGLTGLGVSAELTRIHVLTHTDPSFRSVCAVNQAINCETVALSVYSVVAGVPVSLWGLLGYAVMLGLALSSLSSRRLHPAWPWGLLLLLTAFSVAASAALAFISATRIRSLCLFCTASYAVNAVLLVLAVLAVRRAGAPPGRLVVADLTTLLRRPALAGGLVLAGCASVGALETAVPPYWEPPAWSLASLPSGDDEQGHHWIGAPTPTLIIVEYSDYECPYCRSAHRSVRALVEEHPERIRLVHRQLPLDEACHPQLDHPFHPHACRFAEAAECAGLQGKFWQMNDALFAEQDRVASAEEVDLAALAGRVGLDGAAFARCLESHAAAPRVAADLEDSMALGLTGTPSFVIDGRVHVGRIPRAVVDRALARPVP